MEIELGEGFTGDEVAVLVDGREVWRRAGVRTNWSVGIADVVRVADPASLVAVHTRDTAATFRLASADQPVRLRADLDRTGRLHLGPASDQPAY